MEHHHAYAAIPALEHHQVLPYQVVVVTDGPARPAAVEEQPYSLQPALSIDSDEEGEPKGPWTPEVPARMMVISQ